MEACRGWGEEMRTMCVGETHICPRHLNKFKRGRGIRENLALLGLCLRGYPFDEEGRRQGRQQGVELS